MKRFIGTVILYISVIYLVWWFFGGGIDYYPHLDTLQETFFMELSNIVSNIMAFFILFVIGMFFYRNK